VSSCGPFGNSSDLSLALVPVKRFSHYGFNGSHLIVGQLREFVLATFAALFTLKDPDGHPLEICSFPLDKGDSKWHVASDAR
jgi:hypothetical protein